MRAQTQHSVIDVAEHFTQGVPETTSSDGKHESRLDYVFPNTPALRAARRFAVSQKQVVPKRKLLVVEIELEVCTATHMLMVSQAKLEAPYQKKLEKDFEKSWDGKRQHCGRVLTGMLLMERGRCSAVLTTMSS